MSAPTSHHNNRGMGEGRVPRTPNSPTLSAKNRTGHPVTNVNRSSNIPLPLARWTTYHSVTKRRPAASTDSPGAKWRTRKNEAQRAPDGYPMGLGSTVHSPVGTPPTQARSRRGGVERHRRPGGPRRLVGRRRKAGARRVARAADQLQRRKISFNAARAPANATAAIQSTSRHHKAGRKRAGANI